jgi:hypothetical protein
VKALNTLNQTSESGFHDTTAMRLTCANCLQKQPSHGALNGKVPCDIVAFAEEKKSSDGAADYHDI